NAAVVMDSADLDASAEGVMRSAFGLQNQKCSATSRVYVHRRVKTPFLEKLLAKTKAITLGDPTERDVFFGPVINREAVARFERAAARAGREGRILLGGARLTGGAFDRGHYVAPTIVELPLASSLFFEELFLPLLAIGEVSGLGQVITETTKAEKGHGRASSGRTAGPRHPTRRSTRSSSRAGRAPWSRTWTGTAISTSWRGSPSRRPGTVTRRSCAPCRRRRGGSSTSAAATSTTRASRRCASGSRHWRRARARSGCSSRTRAPRPSRARSSWRATRPGDRR